MDTLTPSIKYYQSTFQAQIEKDTVESTREITFVIASEATGARHRNKFMYNWDAWDLESYNSNPVVGYDHHYGDDQFMKPNPDDIIGKATAWMDTFKGKRVLMSKVTFEPAELNATADKVFRKILFGSLNSSSTGVIPTGPIKTEMVRNSKNEIIDYTLNFPGQQLVEWSIVHIPADPKALRAAKIISDLQQLTEEELEQIKEALFPKPVLSGPDPNLNKYLQIQQKRKNGSIKK